MAHNDHLKQPNIERAKGSAKGVYYKGIAMTTRDFIMVAPTVEGLREAWAKVSTAPLNEEACVPVGMFAEKNIQEEG